MRLVSDASALVAEALRARGRALLARPDLDLLVAAEAWGETEHKLRSRVALIVRRGQLSSAAATGLLEEALAVLAARVTFVPAPVYADRLEEARRRISRDPRDAPTVALALSLECGIWTNDYDFFGCGVPVWTTDTLMLHLAFSRDP